MAWFWNRNKKENQTAAQAPSVYGQVLSSLDENGQLPHTFSLPQEETPGGLHFTSGALDGIGIFHSAGRTGAGEVDELEGLLANACRKLDGSARQQIAAFLKEHRVVGLVDPLLDRIREGRGELAPERLLVVGYALMTESADAESVKLGIALCGLFRVGELQDFRKAILALGQCDEFTLFSLVAVGGWQGGNDLVFRLARQVRGWGKIHAVERLEPATQEIRDWIIRDGCGNCVLDAYLGLTCARKCDLLRYLQRESLPADLLRGAGVILSGMLEEGPCPGISAYEHAGAAIREYLRHAERSESLQVLCVVLELRDWLQDCDLPEREALAAACSAIADRKDWPQRILQAIDPRDRTALWQATFAAGQIGVDITEPLFEILKSDPLEYCVYARDVCRTHEHAAKVFALYEQVLPLSQIASGMGDELGFDPAFEPHRCLDMVLQELDNHPGMGIPLITAGLGAPVTRCRNMALGALESWTADGAQLEDFSPALRPLLEQVRAAEVNDTTRKALDALLA